MTNLTLGLAQFLSWLIPYTGIGNWLVDFNLRNFAALGALALIWLVLTVLLWRKRHAIVIGPMYYLLALSNVLALLVMIVHTYNDYRLGENTAATMSIEEIMAPPFSMSVELYLGAIYPFVKVLLLVSTLSLVVSFAKSCRRGNQSAA